MQGSTEGIVRWLLRLEGLCMFTMALLVYSWLHFDWGTFVKFILVPDLSMLAFLAGPRAGAILYNIGHSYIGAFACLVAGMLLSNWAAVCAGTIWCAHIGFDRALGYGLKYPAGFGFTHLGILGQPARLKLDQGKLLGRARIG